MPIQVVCLSVGDKYGDEYVERLYSMVARNLSEEFTFVCFTDRPRNLPAVIEQRSTAHWTTTGWFGKLKLFDRAEINTEFLFLDLALVVMKSLDPFLDWARQHVDSGLIGMRDWNYDCFGSMVMWVRPGEYTQGMWDEYESGVRYPHQTPIDGDQDFIDGYIRAHAGPVSYFPQDWFVSYKALRKAHADDRPLEEQMLKEGKLLKFHGPPKMHELLDWKVNLRLLLKHKPFRTFAYWRYMEKEVREWWS